MDGGDGDDALLSGIGNDTINGGLGKDIIFGDTGTDTLTGGPGLDYFFTFDDDRITDFNEEEGDVLNYGVSNATDLLSALRDLFSDLDLI